ncbi:hypothetical protein BDV34DRAFT_223501 [Aspergillus parasiticus]|uniref:Protein kinase domain-containing protein n=1 Tax=Aspergillus parasiticus TaxID=5067 RepID=A0A5N6DR22_ASPPA|nr:hypothetical protein BDV34DRAFT_223501 [Aspergillus parasiticus]
MTNIERRLTDQLKDYMLGVECWSEGLRQILELVAERASIRIIVDIWNVDTMIWDLFEGKHMFYGNDPDGKGYSTRAHFAEVIGFLGTPPLDMLQRRKRSNEFFTDDGQWRQDIEIPNQSLESSARFLEGRNKEIFLAFIRGMLQWKPEDRKTARELLEDPWLNDRLE